MIDLRSGEKLVVGQDRDLAAAVQFRLHAGRVVGVEEIIGRVDPEHGPAGQIETE